MTPSVCRGRADSNSASLLAYCRPRCVDRGRERQWPFSASMLAHPHLSYRIIGDVLAGDSYDCAWFLEILASEISNDAPLPRCRYQIELDFSSKNCTCCIQNEGITVWLVLDLDLSLGLGGMQLCKVARMPAMGIPACSNSRTELHRTDAGMACRQVRIRFSSC